jgi:hypothetical protein
MIAPYNRKNVKNTASSYSDPFLQNQNSKMNNNDNNTYRYPDNVAINSLDIADGLKELLIRYGFTLEVLSNMPYSELSKFLGIDSYIAQLIGNAVVKPSNENSAVYDISNANLRVGNSIT